MPLANGSGHDSALAWGCSSESRATPPRWGQAGGDVPVGLDEEFLFPGPNTVLPVADTVALVAVKSGSKYEAGAAELCSCFVLFNEGVRKMTPTPPCHSRRAKRERESRASGRVCDDRFPYGKDHAACSGFPPSRCAAVGNDTEVSAPRSNPPAFRCLPCPRPRSRSDGRSRARARG